MIQDFSGSSKAKETQGFQDSKRRLHDLIQMNDGRQSIRFDNNHKSKAERARCFAKPVRLYAVSVQALVTAEI